MPLLSKMEQKAVFDTYLAIRPQKGKWIKLVRIPSPKSAFSTFVTYNDDARQLALWHGFTLIHDDDRQRVQFGSPVLPDVETKVRSKGYRLIIVDAPTGLLFH